MFRQLGISSSNGQSQSLTKNRNADTAAEYEYTSQFVLCLLFGFTQFELLQNLFVYSFLARGVFFGNSQAEHCIDRKMVGNEELC